MFYECLKNVHKEAGYMVFPLSASSDKDKRMAEHEKLLKLVMEKFRLRSLSFSVIVTIIL